MGDTALAKAHRTARQLLHSNGVRAPEHIDVEAIAHSCGADVVVGKLEGSTARVFRAGRRARIRVSDRLVTEGARRFSVAHELGHLLLGHEVPTEADVSRFLARACARLRDGGQDPEREANAFAAELLMPKAFVKRKCQVSPVDLTKAHAIASEYRTSIVASARRFAELSNEACAAIYSEAGEVKWSVPSATFTYDIARGTKLDSSSAVATYVTRGHVAAEPCRLPPRTWLPGTANDAELVVEHAEIIPEWGGVLSMLWVPGRSGRRSRRAKTTLRP